MNKRILELAEQSGYTKDMFGVGHWDMPECKKFAELIVQECIGIIGYNDLVGDSTEYYGKKIREHFGVTA